MDGDAQKAFFETFGYLFLRDVFSSDEIGRIAAEADDLWAEERGGGTVGEMGQAVAPFVEKRPPLTALVEDDRIYGVVASLLGPGLVWAGSEGNITVRGEHPWHPDRPGDDEEITYDRVKVNIYLDAVDRAHGCLRLIPGSHRNPVHEAIEPENRHQHGPFVAPFGVPGDEMPCVAVESRPGDVIFFHQSLWHAVFNGWPGRRYIALKYAAEPVTDKQVSSLAYYGGEEMFAPSKSLMDSDRPRIRGLVERLHEYGARDVPEFVPFRDG